MMFTDCLKLNIKQNKCDNNIYMELRKLINAEDTSLDVKKGDIVDLFLYKNGYHLYLDLKNKEKAVNSDPNHEINVRLSHGSQFDELNDEIEE